MQQKLVIVLKNDSVMVTWGTKEQQENTMGETFKVLHGKEPKLQAKNTLHKQQCWKVGLKDINEKLVPLNQKDEALRESLYSKQSKELRQYLGAIYQQKLFIPGLLVKT